MTITFDEEKNKKRLDLLHSREEEDLALILSKKYGIPYIDLTRITIDTNGLREIPEEKALKAKIAAFDLVGKKMKVAMLSPNKEETQNEIKELERRGYIIEPYMSSNNSLKKAWSRYKDITFAKEMIRGTLDISSEDVEGLINEIKKVDDVKNLVAEIMQMKKSFRISRIVETVLAGAISTGASDIHVEPEGEQTRLRFRLDGVLVEITQFDPETYRLLLSRIKLLSGMKLNVKETAQDGRFTVKIGQTEIEIRSSVLPGNYGESIVMRILNPESIQVPIKSLGVSEKLMKIFMEQISKPNGMILNTGPTGSGKTTTLYAFLREKKTPEIKIITIEDPVEYHLDGVVQTQVDNKKGYDFATGLKKTLRQDPDVIMVGEIRDLETAETAVHAALTGHLVFSTLHTNNAAGTFPRLIDLGVNPKIITSAINMTIAQRLVRTLCDECKQKTTMSAEEKDLLKKVYDGIEEPEIPWTEEVYSPGKCEKCNHTGYKGRIGIFEAILADKALEDILNTNPSEVEIKQATKHQGIMDMSEDGVIKILKGMTTISEVMRVVDLKKKMAHDTLSSNYSNNSEISEMTNENFGENFDENNQKDDLSDLSEFIK